MFMEDYAIRIRYITGTRDVSRLKARCPRARSARGGVRLIAIARDISNLCNFLSYRSASIGNLR